MSSRFLTPLRVERIDGKWMLTEPLSYYSLSLDRIITAPVGFWTDFASVPRIPIAYLLFGDIAHEPAVIHDYLYAIGWPSRRIADRVLLEALESVGASRWRRWAMWAAVRVGGWAAW